MKETDEEIFGRFQKTSGNDDLKILLERYREELTFFLFGIVKNMEDAEDLMLEAFATIASGTAKFSGKSSFKTWLFGIARNLAANSMRKKHFSFSSFDEGTDEEGTEEVMPDVALLNEERNRILYAALKNINSEYRHVLHLLYFEKMEIEEIALILKKSKKQVYNLLNRGRQTLKAELESTGYTFWE